MGLDMRVDDVWNGAMYAHGGVAERQRDEVVVGVLVDTTLPSRYGMLQLRSWTV